MPLKIWSWLDLMRLFDLHGFSYSVKQVASWIWLADRHDEKEEIDAGVVVEMEALVQDLAADTKRLQLKASYKRAKRELRQAFTAYGTPTWGGIKQQFVVFWEILEPELAEKRVVCIDGYKNELLNSLIGDPPSVSASDREDADPLWEHMWKRFPSAKEDGQEAIYCYALERNTACVFHCMRVAEVGLRALARRMKVKLPKQKKLEWAQWQEILREMQVKTDHIHKTKKAGKAKDEALEFYNGAIGEFYGFKDEFRNQIMHVRKSYDDLDAQRALRKMRDFMSKLSEKTDEKGRVVKEKRDWLADL